MDKVNNIILTKDCMIKERLGRNIKNLRLKKDMTIEEVAVLSGISPKLMTIIEEGRRVPSVENVLVLAEAFGIISGSLLMDMGEDVSDRNKIKLLVNKMSSAEQEKLLDSICVCFAEKTIEEV